MGPTSRRWPFFGLTGSLALFALAFTPRAAEAAQIRLALATIGPALAIWLGWLLFEAREGRRTLNAVRHWRKPHLVQICAHSSIYTWWALHVPLVRHELPLIASQIVFAYVLDMCLSWTRRRPFLISAGPFPIIFSLNLFTWFRDDHYALQYGLVALTFLLREFARWKRDGQDIHIFNPSAGSLAIVSALLLATHSWDITWGETISTTLENAPHMYELIFACGIVAQLFFRVTPMTVGAVLTAWGLVTAHHALTGDYYYVHTSIPIAVFLGMTLLFTDPSTSPASFVGRLLFGIAYGGVTFGLYRALQDQGFPAFYDKLLPVPILNLLVPAFDKVGRAIEGALDARWPAALRRNPLHVAAWAGAFLVLRPELVDHPGAKPDFWRAQCDAGAPRGCVNLASVLRYYCAALDAAACEEVSAYFGDVHSLDYDRELAAHFRERACALGRSSACGPPAPPTSALVKTTTQVPKEQREAACRAGDGPACTAYAKDLAAAEPPDMAGAASAFNRACDEGEAESCANLGLLYLNAQGVPQDKAKGLALHERACTGGVAVACGRVGYLYEKGEGTAQDAGKAQAYFALACKMGDRGACNKKP